MNRIKIFQQVISLTLVALLLVGCSGAQVDPTATVSVSSDKNQDIQQAVDEFITPYVEDGYFGGSILIAQGENILISKGYGMANLEHDVPNTPQTKFRIGSVTKQFTAMAILLLQEQGQLSVQDPVCDHIPDCPEAWQPITIHHLLTHSSGIPDYRRFPDYRETMTLESTVEDTLKRFRDKPLRFAPPGATFDYSNSGYIVLGYIIEQVSETSYAEYLRENIFEPLNMMNTGYDFNHIVLKDRASGYRRVGANKFRNAAYIDMSIPHADGGLYSAVEDLYLWDRALYTETLVSQNSLDMMFTPFVDMSPTAGYGYGWVITKESNRGSVWHTGEDNGFRAYIERFIDDDVVIIVLSNIENASLGPGTPLTAIVFGEE